MQKPADEPESQSSAPRGEKESREANDNYSRNDVSLVKAIRDWFRHVFGFRTPESLREVVEEALEEHKEQVSDLDPDEKLLLSNVLDFGDLEVSDVMVQRNDVVAVPYNVSLQALKEVILDREHSRLPVYKKSLDDITGFIHIKDLVNYLGEEKEFNAKDIIRPLMAVPPTMKVTELLADMRSHRSHMALVVDEYGGTDGIVTLENIFEELVGDIQDEHDENEMAEEFTVLSGGAVVADARIEIERIEDQYDLSLYNEDEDDFHTLGGLIFNILGHVPEKGEQIEYRGLIFKIVEADRRRIKRVRVRRSDG